MSDSDTEAKELVPTNFETKMTEMSGNLRLFSRSIRSLYSDQNPGTSNNVTRKLTEIRDDTRNDAKVYLNVILPLTTKFACAIKDFFDYYDALSYEEWSDSLPDILEDIKDNKDLAETLVEMHQDFIVPLKKREDVGKTTMIKSKDLEATYKQEKEEFEAKARKKRKWAFALAFVPLVNIVATPLLRSSANGDSAKAVVAGKELVIHKDAVVVLEKSLIPGLANFISGLETAAGFFENMEKEFNSLEKKGMEIKSNHYKLMKNRVQKINESCQTFHEALPAVRTDFEAIPDGDTQQNYVQKWLEERLEKIQRKRESTRMHFSNVVQGIQEISLKSIMNE